MATIIYPGGSEQEVQPRNGSDFKLDELNAIVEGSIEIIYLPDGQIMVCNDESKLLSLPRNDRATKLAGLPTPQERDETIQEYKQRGIEVITGFEPGEEDYIAGTVLFCLDLEVQ